MLDNFLTDLAVLMAYYQAAIYVDDEGRIQFELSPDDEK